MYRIKYFNTQTEERVEFSVSSHRELEVKLEQAEIDPLNPFWVKLGTSDEIPVE